jgi:hypothetical protein
MLIVEAFAAKNYTPEEYRTLTKVAVNIPAVFPLSPQSGASKIESIQNPFLNITAPNTVKALHYVEIEISRPYLPDAPINKRSSIMSIIDSYVRSYPNSTVALWIQSIFRRLYSTSPEHFDKTTIPFDIKKGQRFILISPTNNVFDGKLII